MDGRRMSLDFCHSLLMSLPWARPGRKASLLAPGDKTAAVTECAAAA